MANLQVKDIDEALYGELRRRAALEGSTIREYVLRLIRRDLNRPHRSEWLAMVASLTPPTVARPAADDLATLRGAR